PGPGEVLVKIEACGICGTDLKISTGILPGTRLPLVMGHEPAGTVARVGSAVKDLEPGDRVCVHFYVTCGRCAWCRGGRESICPNLVGQLGFHLDGGFAEYLTVPADNCLKVPAEVSFSGAAILGDAVATGYHAVQRAGVKPGQLVLVMGAGGVGLHLVQMAKVAGACVAVVDVDEARLDLARRLGADHAVRFEAQDYLAQVGKLAGGEPVSAVFETVGLPETLAANVRLLGRGGKLMVIGYKPGHVFPLDPLDCVNREIEVRGVRASCKEELRATIKLVAAGNVVPVITREFALPEVNAALAELKAGRITGRAVVLPG
ncbi:MAG TPA: alcohol dehydrogenase catalytic domain-containing protein, partial [Spirochaetia bacterium]|nr:alcohol dehydrogenase catalytic domain-containing protein [Spirochaetia bacterium]